MYERNQQKRPGAAFRKQKRRRNHHHHASHPTGARPSNGTGLRELVGPLALPEVVRVVATVRARIDRIEDRLGVVIGGGVSWYVE